MNTTKPGTGRRQISLCVDTISHLEQKVIRLEQELTQARHVAQHDALTGLPNRSLLWDRFNQAIAQPSPLSFHWQ